MKQRDPEDLIPRQATPRSIMRHVRSMEGSPRAEVMGWLRAVAPEAFCVLYGQLKSESEDIAQRAALSILQWSVGKPATREAEKAEGRGGKIYEVVAPSEAPSFDEWVEGLSYLGNGKGNGMARPAGASGGTSLVPRP